MAVRRLKVTDQPLAAAVPSVMQNNVLFPFSSRIGLLLWSKPPHSRSLIACHASRSQLVEQTTIQNLMYEEEVLELKGVQEKLQRENDGLRKQLAKAPT